MRASWCIFKFVFLDNLRSIWSVAYALFFALSVYSLIHFTGSFTRAVVSIMNIILLVAPLMSAMMMSMYYFNKTDFLHLLLAQPVRRWQVFLGMYLGVAFTLALSVLVGLGLGVLISLGQIDAILPLITLMASGSLLSLIFAALAMLVSVASKDKLRGIGLTLFVWLFLAVIYDGLILIYFSAFSEYPIEQHAIVLSLMNPIDLSRIFIMLQLDVSALLGYSGAVFHKFFGSTWGQVVSLAALMLWVVLPILTMLRTGGKKDF